jgi:two-component sensor histidine kinase
MFQYFLHSHEDYSWYNQREYSKAMKNRQRHLGTQLWKPITFDDLLSRYSLSGSQVWKLLGIWIVIIFTALAATLFLLPEEWMLLTGRRSELIQFFVFNPALILGMLLFFWFGFEWGFIPIFLSSFIIAFHSNMPWGWALIFGIAFVFGLAICAMAYQGFNISYNLKSFKSIVFYVSITFIASIGSSMGAFIWSFTHKLSAYETLLIWKSWWSGSFLQALLIIGPCIWLFSPAIERFKNRRFNISRNQDVSMKWVFGSVSSITGALALFIFSGKLLGKMRVQEVMTTQEAATVMDVVNALDSFEIISWISIGIIIVTGYGAFTLIGGWNKRLSEEVENRTEELNKSQEKLRVSLEEKEILLQEIHHRVKNNMALVSALLELQERTSGDGDSQKKLQTARSRIKSMAMAHEALYENKSFSNISMKEYVKRIGKLTHKSFADGKTEINLELDLEDTSLEMSQSIPFGLLVNEILINAYKHAFKDCESGCIQLESKVENGQIHFSIRDNGVGMPSKDNLRNGSLGMKLINKFSKQLKADLSIQSEKGQGTEFSLVFEN